MFKINDKEVQIIYVAAKENDLHFLPGQPKIHAAYYSACVALNGINVYGRGATESDAYDDLLDTYRRQHHNAH